MRENRGMPGRILLVEDDESIRTQTAVLLEDEGYEVDQAATSSEAVTRFERRAADCVLLDVMLPDGNGFDTCRVLRSRSKVPIIMVTARTDTYDVVAGLEAGADDYVTKPFGAEELLARVRASLRRAVAAPAASGEIVRGDLTIDLDRRRVLRDGEEIRLTPKEFELLVFVAQHSDRVLTHRTILKAIWGPHSVEQPEHLRVLMAALRKKIEPEPARPRYLLTEPWVGYRFKTSEPTT